MLPLALLSYGRAANPPTSREGCHVKGIKCRSRRSMSARGHFGASTIADWEWVRVRLHGEPAGAGGFQLLAPSAYCGKRERRTQPDVPVGDFGERHLAEHGAAPGGRPRSRPPRPRGLHHVEGKRCTAPIAASGSLYQYRRRRCGGYGLLGGRGRAEAAFAVSPASTGGPLPER